MFVVYTALSHPVLNLFLTAVQSGSPTPLYRWEIKVWFTASAWQNGVLTPESLPSALSFTVIPTPF